jgi:crotonobetainyl-CoA:carnitine CoA-transferase CaiB-like acyl-CoA transferase
MSRGPLARLRVLDLTDDRGIVAGKILADLGATVLAIEPPGGSPARRRGPFLGDAPARETSLFWRAYATGRHGITLALECAAGAAILRHLAGTTDVLIESFGPGRMEALGLGYERLAETNPRLVYTAVRGFGEDGPLAGYAARDLVLWAMGGMMQLSGDADRPPVRVSFPQAYLHAGAEAAAGTLMALAERRRSGRGQRVEVSAQACVVWTLMNAQQTWDLLGVNLPRGGAVRPHHLSTHVSTRSIFACADGYVSMSVRYGPGASALMGALVDWMDRDGLAPDWLRSFGWDEIDPMQLPPEAVERVETAVGRFFRTKTMAELHEGALVRRIMLMPVNTAADVYISPQLAARDYWREVEAPGGRMLRHPGPFAKLSRTPIRPFQPAPALGASNTAVYCGLLGFARSELAALKAGGIV